MTSLHILESKALRHWNEFLPSMVASLIADGQLETRVRNAAMSAQQEIRELTRNGYREHEAEEVVLPHLILLKPEADAGPPWERDELAKKEAQYQAMMAEPETDESVGIKTASTHRLGGRASMSTNRGPG